MAVTPRQAERRRSDAKARRAWPPHRCGTQAKQGHELRGATTAREGRPEAPRTSYKRPGRAAAVKTRQCAKADARTRKGAKRNSQKNISTYREASAIFRPCTDRRKPAPDGSGRRKWKRGANGAARTGGGSPGDLSGARVRAWRANSGAAGGEEGERRRRKMRFRMPRSGRDALIYNKVKADIPGTIPNWYIILYKSIDNYIKLMYIYFCRGNSAATISKAGYK